LAGERKRNKLHLGPSSNGGFAGLFGLDTSVTAGETEIGMEAARNLFHERPIIVMDPGINKLVAVEVFYGHVVDEGGYNFYKSESVRFAMSSAEQFHKTGTADLIHRVNEEQANLHGLPRRYYHGKTLISEDYKNFGLEFKEREAILLGMNTERRRRRAVHYAQRKRQRYYSHFVNTLFAVCERLCSDANAPMIKMPVIVFGSAKIHPVRGHRAPNSMWLRRYFANHFLVLLINEHNTSQKCPVCFGQSQSREKNEWTMKRCTACKRGPNDEYDFCYDRDYGATKNMLSIALALLRFGKRPTPFQR
jgi:hypothetical protein